jgi:CHASE3 domain sensor protein
LSFFVRRRIVLGLIIGILFILFSALGTFVINEDYTTTVNELSHYNTMQSLISNLTVEVDDAETGQRGFLITDNATYLTPYVSALNSINATNAALGLAVAGNSNLTSLYQQLQPAISQKLSELNETISLRETEGFAAAQAVVNTNAGQQYMNDIRAVLGQMNANISAVESAEKTTAVAQSSERIDSTVFNALVAVGAFSFAVYAAVDSLGKEQKARREAELLQDILTHDIRNYNQVSKMGTEMLYDLYQDDPRSRGILSSVLDSIEGSSQLAEKGKKLGKVLSEEKPKLGPIDLLGSIENSLNLVENSSRETDKTIEKTIENLTERTRPTVMADELLDDVFTNLLSNSVKYTEGKDVSIRIVVEPDQKSMQCWKISITDAAKGIPDEQKKVIFSRYLKGAKGTGLGMSIVHALVVERYDGRIEVKNAVPDDYRKGTTVEIWLLKGA